MSGLVRAVLEVREWTHLRRFEAATGRPEVAQARLLRRLVEENAATRFGRDHGFGSVASPGDYRGRVPIRDYEGFRPYVDRILAGESRVLTGEPPGMFATTSGTTSEPKLIPVTRSWAAEWAALMRLWMLRALRDHPALLDRRTVSVVSPAVEGTTATGIPVGAVSGLTQQRLPWLARRRAAVPYATALIGDAEARYFVTMRLALAHSVSAIGTPNPTTLVRLAETAASRAEAIIRAVHDGTLGIPLPPPSTAGDVGTEDAIRRIAAALRPDRARAHVLAAAAEVHGRLLPRHCWPDLALVSCWLGGNAGVHARRLATYFGDVPLRDLGLLASEGRLTVPVEDGTPAGVLAVHANFYEFVPEERIEERPTPVLLAHELEDGKRYYVVLTGGNGLYRYDLNDIVEVQGFYRRTPIVAFVRKGRDMVSITGEKLHLNHIQAAIDEAERRTGLMVWQFRLIPDVEERRYDLLIEPGGGVGAEGAAGAFLTAFDEGLAARNREYAGKRESSRLEPPRLAVMRSGWSERICRADFERGKREVQYKWQAIRLEWDPASRAEVLYTVEPATAGRS